MRAYVCSFKWYNDYTSTLYLSCSITSHHIHRSINPSINQPIDRSTHPSLSTVDAILLTMSRYQKKQSAMVQAAAVAYSPVVDFTLSLSLQDDALARKISGKYPVIPAAMEPKALIDNMVCMYIYMYIYVY